MEVDLYGDLNEFQLEQDVKEKSAKLNSLQKKYNYAIKTIKELQININKYKTKIHLMEKNFGSLLLTARTEIERKNKEITSLRNRIDSMCFRRVSHIKTNQKTKTFVAIQPREENKDVTTEKRDINKKVIAVKKENKDVKTKKLEVKKKPKPLIKISGEKFEKNAAQEMSEKTEMLNIQRKIAEDICESETLKLPENNTKLDKQNKKENFSLLTKNMDDILFEELVFKDFERTDTSPLKKHCNSMDDINLLYNSLTPQKLINEENKGQEIETNEQLRTSLPTKEININEKKENLQSESKTSNDQITDENEFLRVMNLTRVKRVEPANNNPIGHKENDKKESVITESTVDTSRNVFSSQSGIFSAISETSKTFNNLPTFFGDSDKILSPQKADTYQTLQECNKEKYDSLEATLEKMFSDTGTNEKVSQNPNQQSSISEAETSAGKAQVMFDLYLSSSTAPIPSGTEMNSIDVAKDLNSTISGMKKRKCSTPKKALPGRNTKLIGHRIEGFEPTTSGEQTLKASKLKNALFEEALKMQEMSASLSEIDSITNENRDDTEIISNNPKESESDDQEKIREVKTEQISQEDNKKSGELNEFESGNKKTSTPNSKTNNQSLLNERGNSIENNNTFSEVDMEISEKLASKNTSAEEVEQNKTSISTNIESERDKVLIYRRGLDPRKMDSITSRTKNYIYLTKIEWYKESNEVALNSADFLQHYCSGTEMEKRVMDKCETELNKIAIDGRTSSFSMSKKSYTIRADDKNQQKYKIEKFVQEFCKSIKNIDEETVPDCCVPIENAHKNNTGISFMKDFENKGFSEYLSNANNPDCSTNLEENHNLSEQPIQNTNSDIQNSNKDNIEKKINDKIKIDDEKSTAKQKTEKIISHSENVKRRKRKMEERNCKRFLEDDSKGKTELKRKKNNTEEQSVNKNTISLKEVKNSSVNSTEIYCEQEVITERRQSPRNLRNKKDPILNQVSEKEIRRRKHRNNTLKKDSTTDMDESDNRNDLSSEFCEKTLKDKSHMNLLLKNSPSLNETIAKNAITKRKNNKTDEHLDTKLLKENINDTINKSIRNISETKNTDSTEKSSNKEIIKFSRDSSSAEKCPFQRTNLNISSNQQDCNDSSLNNSQEKKNISIASANYLIEVVDKNIVNVFITRKKKRKKSL